MSEETKVVETQANETTVEQSEPSSTEKVEKTFSRDDVNKMIAAEKAKAAEAAKAEMAEAEKLSHMKDDEKRTYELEQAKLKAETATKELDAYRLKDEARKIAEEKKVPEKLLNLINYKDETAEGVSARIDEMAEAFSMAVKTEVEFRLKQKSPTTHNSSQSSESDADLEKWRKEANLK